MDTVELSPPADAAIQDHDIIPSDATLRDPILNPIPYYTSAFSGQAWVDELLSGHPERIRCELGVCKEVFKCLIADLRDLGLQDSHNVTLEEKLAIFLYMCVTGLKIQHVGERFQRANGTITKYFVKILGVFSSPPFYTANVHLPQENAPIPPFISQNPEFFPFFKDAIGAIGGTYIDCFPMAAEQRASQNQNGGLTQNCLAACSFNYKFVYTYTSWRSVTDSTDLSVPRGKYYLADAGFPSSSGFLTPYCGVRYHTESRHSSRIPKTPQELFNRCHASARSMIECIFDVLRRRFKILVSPPGFHMNTQVQIPAALAALHNYILDVDPDEIKDWINVDESNPGTGEFATNNEEQMFVGACRDAIAQQMWAALEKRHRAVLQERHEADLNARPFIYLD